MKLILIIMAALLASNAVADEAQPAEEPVTQEVDCDAMTKTLHGYEKEWRYGKDAKGKPLTKPQRDAAYKAWQNYMPQMKAAGCEITWLPR